MLSFLLDVADESENPFIGYYRMWKWLFVIHMC